MIRAGTDGTRFLGWAACAMLVLAISLGGGTVQGLPAEAWLQAAGILLLAAVLYLRAYGDWPIESRWVWLLALAILAWLGLQLIPLPASWWTALAGRSVLVEELAVAGVPLGNHPISLDPQASLRSILAWLLPLGMFATALSVPWHWRLRCLHMLLILAALSVVLGFLQLAGGNDSPLRLYEVTNLDQAVGPFANRNHLASLMAICLPLAAAALLGAVQMPPIASRPIRIAAMLGVLCLLILGVATARSRSGLVLMGIAVLATAVLAWRHRHASEQTGVLAKGRRWLLAALALGVVLSIQFGLAGALSRLAEDPWVDDRWTMARTTLEASRHYGVLGAGAGTFVAVYQSVEPPSQRTEYYANRAHNDWLEWRLEGGWPLIGVLLLALLWWSRTSWRAWHSDEKFGLWRASAALSVWLLLIHSLVDYPLRTTAMSVVGALLLACAMEYPAQARRGRRAAHESGSGGNAGR